MNIKEITMRHKPYYLLLFLILSSLFSCKSYKDLTYLQDVGENEDFLRAMPKEAPPYLIRPNDNLFVSILTQNPEMNMLYNPAMPQTTSTQAGTQQMYGELTSQYLNGYPVDLDGYIMLPVLGKINVESKTLPEAEERIKAKALEYLKEATVKVKLLNYKITVLGEVNTPGIYYNYDKSISVLDILSKAQGNTDFAQIDHVLVLRHKENGTETFRLNLQSSDQLLNSDAYYLQPDDIVYVEPGRNKNIKLRSPAILLYMSGITTLVLIINLINNVN